MPIVRELRGDIFKSKMQTLVVPVNTQGTLGAGLAKQFKIRYPGLLAPYKRACFNGTFSKKGYFLYTVDENRKILCLPSKQRWVEPSRIEWIDIALERITEHYKEDGIESLSIPAIGCGLGELSYDEVHPLIVKYMSMIDIPVVVYLP